jgi:hypothetical protein
VLQLAEKAAWNFINDNKPSFGLATICPPYVFGPILHQVDKPESLNTSVATFYSIVKGSKTEKDLPGPVGKSSSLSRPCPAIVLRSKEPGQKLTCRLRSLHLLGNWVDVREVADAHFKALTVEKANGNRFCVSAGPFCTQGTFRSS